MKRTIAILLTVVILLGTCACGETGKKAKQSEGQSGQQTEVKPEKEEARIVSQSTTTFDGTSTKTTSYSDGSKVVETTKPDGSVITEKTDADGNTTKTAVSPSGEKVDTTPKLLKAGGSIKTDYFEFTLNNVELTYELRPRNTSSVYTSYTAEQGKVYVHVDATYTNTSKRTVCIRDLFVPKVVYGDGYAYEGFVAIDDGDNDFDYVSSYVAAEPLTSCHYHGLVECPEVVDKTSEPLSVFFELSDGSTYQYQMR